MIEPKIDENGMPWIEPYTVLRRAEFINDKWVWIESEDVCEPIIVNQQAGE